MHAEGYILKAPGGQSMRTLNMPRVVLMLDVSKLSAWLNALALCRVEKRASEMRGKVRAALRA